MDKMTMKIGELNFNLLNPEDPEILPSLEIENDASMVFENVEVKEALRLRDLLDKFITLASNS